MEYKFLNVKIDGRVLIVEISRPEKLNALSAEVLKEMASFCLAIGSSSRDSSGLERPLGVIFIGAGDKAFVAGADIKEQAQMSSEMAKEFGMLGQRVTSLIEQLPMTTIACVDGYALGGGCELAMACDFIFATEKSIFGQPEVTIGLIPGFGGTVRLMRYVGLVKAKEMIFSGVNISASEAFTAGLVARVSNDRRSMLKSAVELLVKIGKQSPTAVQACKKLINDLHGLSTNDALAHELDAFSCIFSTEDKTIGLQAFLNRSEPHFRGI